MKKEFIMPSLKMKQFSREIVADLSNTKAAQNYLNEIKDSEGKAVVNQVAIITL